MRTTRWVRPAVYASFLSLLGDDSLSQTPMSHGEIFVQFNLLVIYLIFYLIFVLIQCFLYLLSHESYKQGFSIFLHLIFNSFCPTLFAYKPFFSYSFFFIQFECSSSYHKVIFLPTLCLPSIFLGIICISAFLFLQIFT